ncbi:Copper amine oxidase N-terminal domain-containing protein [Caloranaerobacter azorensis DSM 13643]|uniref:Copper amine oxidase N-terminal domain-containing protein n=1 Tax=Caloranaerobacter azorensis DSM 13643 TaxID=1121264 RepID=A0A1M5R387_9FIRM|nr:copper amine oxidase N-terminal domain-containing protein [Caloranaerobacter azorensis]SHH20608.1 Copper amine oxidase N-terminal domain-containing protein [Caloranaerobacter azorensis DSM 13643]
MKLSRGFIFTFIFIFLFSAVVLADGVYKNIKVYFDNININVDGSEIETDTESFIYNDRVYVPIRFVAEKLGKEVKWDNETKTVFIKSYKDFSECNYLEGEKFVYGLITSIDYENRQIVIEQHFDDNSVEVTPLLELDKNAVIILKRNDKKMNIEFNDLVIGDDVGLVINKYGKIRGIIISI